MLYECIKRGTAVDAQLHYRHVCFVKIETKSERYVKWKSKFRRKFLSSGKVVSR